ncbi:pyridoxal 5'-phosphate synthase lyase subunit PdxS [Carnobacterium maltaromaticum]|uniref:pyridoxal 5'-phosphate synthase lyase subunit PdxS n=1 Tax=Carnobacterium maltaromaticum TaxID=2751 RepID=UPI000C7815E1|nr:pyridoxal 5'-phosphate synthase lyase subunit PdxS [Carnobacterium maltaromaticum]PLS34892.1 pyridoxal 5'-phosphate synthase lyase subunit PdxS [Carnobacterium maltaromaticum]PLS36710.1 pyridoxal 5'-phosphate synthase lyase subunit PdxS [Carnobacterium maltaromaticum]PLS37525.1 pyridoxal 5'-phosphate synthase lyase subunit PdxS [Carnobacterium maltaromaticum]PLS43743.1 pyridoxal 5'-phosphate synthase lyase subunit PdxS [Carnobacterium maltaromaticum]PLS44086.1 pyridoxal 5'-phosphate synthas
MEEKVIGSQLVKRGMAQMQKGGVIMDVINAEQAKIAEAAGAVAVMALERVPSDIRAAGGVARMADPTIVEEVMAAVTIPVMAKARIGHIAEARILEAMGVDYIDESEVLTPADEEYHLLKSSYTVPFVCGCRDLGEALRRIGEGASMVRTKGEPGTGNIVEAVRHMRKVNQQIRSLSGKNEDELMTFAKDIGAPYELIKEVKQLGKLPVVNFAAGGVATPADAALMMSLGADGIFVGSGIFKAEHPEKFARSIVEATTHFEDYALLAELSKGLGTPMKGIDISQIPATERMQERGW